MNGGYFESPIGTIAITSEEDAITAVRFVNDRSIEMHENSLINSCQQQLKAYFEGKLDKFNLPCQLSLPKFQREVLKEVTLIRKGQLSTYREIAVKLGGPEKVRAVGMANSRNPIMIVVPCHRVIGSNGQLTGYAGGLDKKRWLLQHEGALAQLQLF